MAVKTRFYRWRKELAQVTSKPGLVVSVVTIGLFILWFASQQPVTIPAANMRFVISRRQSGAFLFELLFILTEPQNHLQVRALFRFLVHWRLAETQNAERLMERYRYLLFGILIIVFVWLDLLIINMLLSIGKVVARWFNEMFLEAPLHTKKNGRPITVKAIRKNPMRSCRKSSSP